MDATTNFDTVLLSDVHLGSEVSRAKEALRMLKTIRFRRLVLLGDIFSDLDFARLKKDHWQFLTYIRKLSNPKRGVEVIWVEGNHDRGLTDVMSHLVGIPVYQEYFWESRGITHLAVHGHQFDRFATRNALWSAMWSSIYMHLQKLDSSRKRFSRLLDRMNTAWLRMTPTVAAGAIAYAKSMGATRVFCGHTHVAIAMERNGVTYFNTGSWVQDNPTYVTIGGEGVKIQQFEDPGENAAESVTFDPLAEDAFDSLPV
jgi:UDP-2,3-diacylglucosamine pyrophosphatase LpxH